jgi:hypothetical protein
VLYILRDRGLKRYRFGFYWGYGISPTTPVKDYMAQPRFEQILRAARCIGAWGRNTKPAYPRPIFGYSFGEQFLKLDFPYAEASMEKALEWWKADGPPPRKKSFLRSSTDWKHDFFIHVSVQFMKDGRDKMPK